MQTIKLNKLYAHRSVWMGLAILWIIFFHTKLSIPNQLVNKVKEFGYAGVDIFLFASGLGCYYSLEKNQDVIQFYKRRIKHLVPTYWVFLIFWCFFKSRTTVFPVQAIVGNYLGMQLFSGLGNEFNWYIEALLVLYLLAPLFYKLTQRIKSFKSLLLVELYLFAVSSVFWNSYRLIILFARVPIFFLGMYFGKLGKENIDITVKYYIRMFIEFLIAFALLFYFDKSNRYDMWAYGLWWYPFIVIAPWMCITISLIVEAVGKIKIGQIICKCLSWFGEKSFSLFLMHIFIFDIIKYFIDYGYIKNTNVLWVGAFFLVLLGAVVLSGIMEWIMQYITKINVERKSKA